MTADLDARLVELVRLRTTSGDPAPQRRAMEVLMDACAGRARVRAHDLDGSHPWVLLDADVDPQIPRLLLAAHVDTVPVADPGSWKHDPYGAEIEDGVLHGRGSADMKAGLLGSLVAACRGWEAGGAVALLLTSDEEIGSLGALRACAAVAALSLGTVIISEPTAGAVHRGHRGALWLEVDVTGRAAHGSTPSRGENAILKAALLVRRAAEQLPLHTDPWLGDETWNLGMLHSGEVPNIVPDLARLVVDHRVVGEAESLRTWWADQPEVGDVRVRVDLAPVHTTADLGWASEVAEGPVPYFTDASALVGAAGDVPLVVWGPGQPGVMHALDEEVSLEEVARWTNAASRLAQDWAPTSRNAVASRDA